MYWFSGTPYCGADQDFKVIKNAYITEAIDGTPRSLQFTNVSNDDGCYQQCIKSYGSNCSFFG